MLLPDPMSVARGFALAGQIRSVEPFGNGLINRTFLVTTDGPTYVLQRLNGAVFPDPAAILTNLDRLGAHLRRISRCPLRIPALVPTRDNELGLWDEAGALWRTLEHISGTRTLTRLDDPAQAEAAGRALGHFHRLCASIDPLELRATLPGFHVTPSYLSRLHQILAGSPARVRTAEVDQALRFVGERGDLADSLEGPRREGCLRQRVTHGDPKLDNILFDAAGRAAVGLIDLDTVQPGLVHHDIGDCLRSCCNRAGEGDSAAAFDLDLCRGLLRGYAHAAEGLLGEQETAVLYDALRLIPFELGLRFLTDHLEGNRYFRVGRPGENLAKACAQFRLVTDIEAKERELRRIISACFDG